jgi:hypothetical protein
MEMVSRLVDAEVREGHVKRPDAQRTIARRAGISPSAIENLQKGRIRYVERISIQIELVYLGFLERQIAALETEVARARARDPRRDLASAEAAIARAKAALGGS